jgi:hypothetical protein
MPRSLYITQSNRVRRITYIRELQSCPAGNAKRVFAIKIGGSAILSSLFNDAGADDSLPAPVGNRSGYNNILRRKNKRDAKEKEEKESTFFHKNTILKLHIN